MNTDEIQQQLNLMAKRMLGKGLRQPDAKLHLSSDVRLYVQLSYYNDDNYCCPAFWDEEAGVALNLAWNHLREIAEGAERERNNYLKKVAEAVEYGKKIGIDDDLINPLIEQMKKLSSNIVEHKPAAAKPEFDYEIPL